MVYKIKKIVINKTHSAISKIISGDKEFSDQDSYYREALVLGVRPDFPWERDNQKTIHSTLFAIRNFAA